MWAAASDAGFSPRPSEVRFAEPLDRLARERRGRCEHRAVDDVALGLVLDLQCELECEERQQPSRCEHRGGESPDLRERDEQPPPAARRGRPRARVSRKRGAAGTPADRAPAVRRRGALAVRERGESRRPNGGPRRPGAVAPAPRRGPPRPARARRPPPAPARARRERRRRRRSGSAGAFAVIRVTHPATDAGIDRSASRGSGAGASTWSIASSSVDSASNGGRPISSSYAIHPIA
jgi:hypothetical protein